MGLKQISYQQKKYWKGILLFFAVSISVGSLIYTSLLVKKLKADQYRTVNILANAYKQISTSLQEGKIDDISFLFEIIKSNENIPLILADTNENILEYRNLDTIRVKNKNFLQSEFRIMKSQHSPIPINYTPTNKHLIYYKNSKLITQLTIYPYIQLFLVILFIIVSYFAFNSSRKYEQNKVWSGMSRETAHQLGTPVSSLIALMENIELSDGILSTELISELQKDIHRLEVITDRFSKIGSIPKFEKKKAYEEAINTIDYLKPRISKKVQIEMAAECDKNVEVPVISSLLSWVIENICKNAVNAMEGVGKITINVSDLGRYVAIDITDNGKGIPRSKKRTVFKAGYTTNARGWGLGLSLAKRIIEVFHKGQIYVKWSELNVGTTFRIKLKK